MILLDTHAVFWLAKFPSRISPTAAEAIREARLSGGLAFSDKTLWELAMMSVKEQVEFVPSLESFLTKLEKTFTVLPITGAVAERSILFSKNYPADPTDRIIGATAVVHGLRLITKDERIRQSGEVDCVW